MIKLLTFISIFLSMNLAAQNKIDLIDTNISNYPVISSDLMIFNENGDLITNLNTTDFVVRDNGVNLNILNIEFYESEILVPSSLIISFDLALKDEINRRYFELGKSISEEIIKYSFVNSTDLAINSFNHLNYLINDFSKDENELLNSLDLLSPTKVSFFESAFIDFPAGSFILADSNQTKDIIIITDNKSNFHNDLILNGLKDRNIRLHCFYLGGNIPSNIKYLVDSTGGFYEDNLVKSSDITLQVETLMRRLEGHKPFKLTWSSDISCNDNHFIQISVPSLSVNTSFSYSFTANEKPYIEADPEFLGYSSVELGTSKYLDITLIARNTDIFVQEFLIEDPRFSIITGNNSNFTITENNFHNLRIEYTPTDSAIVFTELIVKSNACEGENIYITAGFPNTPPITKTIQLTSPKCRETLIVGDTTFVKWIGLLPTDVVQLEFSTNSGTTWDTLAINMLGLELEWIVPDYPSEDCLIKITQLWPNNVGRTLDLHHRNEVNSGFFNKDGSKVLTASSDSTVILWNSNTGDKIFTFRGHRKEVNFASFSPNEELIVSAGDDNLAIVWNAETGEKVAELNHTSRVMSSKFSYNGQLIVTASRDGKTVIWRTSDFSQAIVLNSNPSGVTEYAEFSPDNSRIITGGFSDGLVKIWDWQNQTIEKTLDTKLGENVSGQVVHATYNYDGTKIAASNIFNDKVSVWDVASGDTLFCVTHNQDTSTSIRINSSSFFFSNNLGELLLTAGINDNTAKLWDAQTGEPVFPFELKEHTNGVSTAVFNFDASRVLTASWDSTAKIWNREQNFLQIDTTDCEFAIAYAQAHASDIVFSDVIINNYQDSIIQEFIISDSNFDYLVENVKIIGTNKEDFIILNPNYTPFILDSAGTESIEIRFNPKDIGLREAQIVIYIPGDSLIYNISGIGINKGVISVSDILDFGEVEIGDLKQMDYDIIIQNNSGQNLSIDSVYIAGHSKEEFALITGNQKSTISDGGSIGATFRFTPKSIGLKNAQLIYMHSNSDTQIPSLESPNKINLMGVGIENQSDSITISVGSAIAAPGDIIVIPITISNFSLDALNGYIGFISNIEFNSTILEPIDFDYISDVIVDNVRKMKIELPINNINGDILKNLKFKVGLGNDSATSIKLNYTELIGNNKIKVNEVSGRVTLDNLCNDGGLRLFFTDGELLLNQNKPNPAINQTEIKFEIIETGFTKLFITDSNGKIVENIVSADLLKGAYQYTINTKKLPTGVYYYILQTPTQRITKKMLINK